MTTTLNLGEYATLECPSCERGVRPKRVNADGSVSYTCAARNHEATHGRAENWRISKEGNLLLPNDAGRYVLSVPGQMLEA